MNLCNRITCSCLTRLRFPGTGLGVGMAVVSALMAIYHSMIIGWFLYYLYILLDSLRNESEPPWANCDNEWNTDSEYKLVFSIHFHSCLVFKSRARKSRYANIGVSCILCKKHKAALHVSVSGSGFAYPYLVKKSNKL